jgi:protein-tyrosine phosphatase
VKDLSRTFPLYWIRGFAEGHLAIMPAPQVENLERATMYWKDEGVDVVVSLLERAEALGFVEAERALCEEIGLEFFWFPIKDGSVPPSRVAFDALVVKLSQAIRMSKSVAIHCRAGIGRSSILATAVMNHFQVDAVVALDMVAEARKVEVPQTEEQRQWILGYCAVG